jgi:uncharacterized membrane protein YhdT
LERLKLKRDYYAGGLMIVLGAGAAVIGTGYKFGTLARMGPGFMPVVLGIALAFMGILIAGTALTSSEPDDSKILPDNPQWFGWACIIAGPILFILLGNYAGMVPAVFACVFVCALGDKTATYKSSALLAAGITVFGVALFHYLLAVPFPLFHGLNL